MEIRVKTNDAPTLKTGQKYDLWSYRLLRLTFVIGKIVELFLLEHIICSWKGIFPWNLTGWDWQAGKELCGKVLGTLIDSKLNTSQQHALTALSTRAKGILGCMNRCRAGRSRMFYSILITLQQDTRFLPLKIRLRSTVVSSSEGH